ncbi:protein of unknown function DUF81 [Methanobacterium lacus]|jgi:uncharacterized protein|uniref:Probable membrane transporter protein n=1 Tax=Methanobacterium lacus (strain AL-21) TaxID=877455 RepID=F0T9L7_METLA|nr:sulfite exporter TauE/SafE family protein [Methanobacterium lacus]ADZ08765.1 protein of unknown function DUF81 [Methanobacterium lacus]
MDILLYIIALIITGAMVGFASGLLGVGGGFIMVPVQFFLLTSIGVDPTIAIRVAFGTSLAVILPTAISGTIGHKRRNAVLVRPTILMGISGVLASFAGGTLATNIPGDYLKLAFGVLVFLAAVWMLVAKYPDNDTKPKEGVIPYILIGLFAGSLSGLLGIGGGIVLVPILVFLMNFNLRTAIGTSTAVLVFTAIGGVVSYIINGINVPGIPPYSIGYINLVQLVLLACISTPVAQLGVRVSHNIPEKQLKYIYIVVMIYISLKMMGLA